ncbi:unnamed protein product [Rotaria socialis]|uniref:Uncharacterized protein n=1 Tax=Rotaria socialis TaxID=392032 RepID=A0A819AK04_9BILA|nr:unnamed protein product [Rotaria socialis]
MSSSETLIQRITNEMPLYVSIISLLFGSCESTGILPNGLMLSFSFSTFRNVVKTKQRVGATTTRMTTEQRRTQKAESQLIAASLNWL